MSEQNIFSAECMREEVSKLKHLPRSLIAAAFLSIRKTAGGKKRKKKKKKRNRPLGKLHRIVRLLIKKKSNWKKKIKRERGTEAVCKNRFTKSEASASPTRGAEAKRDFVTV